MAKDDITITKTDYMKYGPDEMKTEEEIWDFVNAHSEYKNVKD